MVIVLKAAMLEFSPRIPDAIVGAGSSPFAQSINGRPVVQKAANILLFRSPKQQELKLEDSRFEDAWRLITPTTITVGAACAARAIVQLVRARSRTALRENLIMKTMSRLTSPRRPI